VTADAEQIAERANDALDQVPTFAEALGCVDCTRIFRCGSACPWCASQSLLNVAGVLNEHRVVERMKSPQSINEEQEG
jgi:hypothetical protein